MATLRLHFLLDGLPLWPHELAFFRPELVTSLWPFIYSSVTSDSRDSALSNRRRLFSDDFAPFSESSLEKKN